MKRTRHPTALLFLMLLLGVGCDAESGTPVLTEVAGPTASETRRPSVLFVGTSLTAGYGLAPELAYPALIQDRIDAASWSFETVNAGVSGDTSSDGVSRLDWLMRRMPVAVVLELGANDGLRGVSVELIEQNLAALIDRIRQRAPDLPIVLAGMQLPPNLGPDYTGPFRDLFPRLAEEKGVALVPFLLQGVAGDRALNQRDGIHPNARGQAILADNVWQVLEPLLRDLHEQGRDEP